MSAKAGLVGVYPRHSRPPHASTFLPPNARCSEVKSSCERSNNVGSVAFFDFDPVLKYDGKLGLSFLLSSALHTFSLRPTLCPLFSPPAEGCARFAVGAGGDWMAQADYQFREAAGHEFGHSILRETPPPRASRAWFGPFPLSMGQSWSWTHKGTSDVLQVRGHVG